MLLVIFGVLIALLSIVGFRFIKENYALYKLKIPSPKVYPFFIEIFYPLLKLAVSSSEDRFKIIEKYATKFPDMLKIWLGTKLIIFVNSPERIQKIIISQKCQEKWVFFYRLMQRPHGLIAASTKEKWKEHRKFFNFCFNLRILESFLPTFVECSEKLCNDMACEAEGKEFDFFAYAKKSSFDILCATMLGTNMSDLKKKPFYEMIFNAFET